MDTATELIERLNAVDECTGIEAKKGGAIHKSVMETVCSFANEPGLEGGYILLGVERDETSLFPSYVVTGINDPDKLQLDLVTQCASMFNMPVRPDVEVEKLDSGKLVMKVWVPELPDAQKPLYFKNEGLPAGAYRRIASSDQRCTDDDLHVFYNKEDSLDGSIVKGATLEDISEEAIVQYRNLRSKVNEYAEELAYEDNELLQSLGCLKREKGEWYVTYAGLLVFGKRQALRRLLPMVRVDYIRVPGNEWVADPANRFETIDMRGPLLGLVQRIFNAITDDLPKGFLLPEGQLQAESVGLPARVLREAIVNALMHRTYRENQPIQFIRYGNRLEIINPGFSLKPQDQLGEPGSKNRNQFIAAIFHETNLAETKGSGIRTMRALMEKAGMAPPTFESDHSGNKFTSRLLLHHFLSEQDMEWLEEFAGFGLSDAQKRGLIFLREAGALDNPTYRQLNGCDVLKASSDLREMRDCSLLDQKGKGRSTYYVAGPVMDENHPDRHKSMTEALETARKFYKERGIDWPAADSVLSKYLDHRPEGLSEPVEALPNQSTTLTEPVEALPNQSTTLTEPVEALPNQLPGDLKALLNQLGKRSNDKALIEEAIVRLCSWKALTLAEIAGILARSEKHLLYNYITRLKQEGRLQYTIPEMPNHPQQAYKAG